jgi:hypothetical protein
MSTAFAVRRRGSLQRQLALFAGLVVRPDSAVPAVLAEGKLLVGFAAIAIACAVAALDTTRFAAAMTVADLVYGAERAPAITLLLQTLGTARTAVVVYLVEQVWSGVLIVTAAGPVLAWILGASAVHAAARIASAGRPFGRFNVFAAYATAAALSLSGISTFVFEADPRSPLAFIGRVITFGLVLWLGSLYYRAIRAYYGVARSRAATILIVAVGLFYLVPLLLIVVAVVAIVAAAILLELA